MTTEISEKFHGPMRRIYLLWTNFKDVFSQVFLQFMPTFERLIPYFLSIYYQMAKRYHIDHCATVIREDISLWDSDQATHKAAQSEELGMTMKHRTRKEPQLQWNQIYLGSSLPSIPIGDIEQSHATDLAFHGFRSKLNRYLNRYLNSAESQFDREDPDQRIYVNFLPTHVVGYLLTL